MTTVYPPMLVGFMTHDSAGEIGDRGEVLSFAPCDAIGVQLYGMGFVAHVGNKQVVRTGEMDEIRTSVAVDENQFVVNIQHGKRVVARFVEIEPFTDFVEFATAEK